MLASSVNSHPQALSCDDFSGRMASPGHSEICLFICCPEVITVPQTFATGEVCLVMGIDDMVKECGIFLYGVGTERGNTSIHGLCPSFISLGKKIGMHAQARGMNGVPVIAPMA